MSLLRCQSCGEVVSSLVSSCPTCGTTVPPRKARPEGALRGLARLVAEIRDRLTTYVGTGPK